MPVSSSAILGRRRTTFAPTIGHWLLPRRQPEIRRCKPQGRSDQGQRRRLDRHLFWLPEEITADVENWRRVRDSEGSEGWVYHSLLSGRTAVVTIKVKDELASIYDRLYRASAIAARLQAGVVTQVKKCANGWCRVIGTGFDGWIEQQRLRGVYADEKVE